MGGLVLYKATGPCRITTGKWYLFMVELRVGHNLQDIIKIIENKMMILIPKFDQYIVFTHCIVSKLMCDYI